MGRPARLVPAPAWPGWRWLLLAIVVVGAYHYTLLTLWASLGSQNPLAYLGLVPFLAVAVAWLRPARLRAPGSDAEFNLLLGFAFLIPALIGLVVLPLQLGATYWAYRLDVLTLPPFVAGAIALLFGYDTLRRLKGPLLFGLLAWPYPYYVLLGRPVQYLTAATAGLTSAVTGALHLASATSVPGVLAVGTAHGPAYLAIGVTCAGLTGLIGLGIVGLGTLQLVDGPAGGKGRWLLLGLALSFTVNLARLCVLVVATAIGGAGAFAAVHLLGGYLLDGVLFVALLGLLPVFGLALNRPNPVRWRAAGWAPPSPAAALLLVALALPIGLADTGLASLSPTVGQMGDARIPSFTAAPPRLPGWTARPVAEYDWSQQYFGPDSRFQRFRYDGPRGRTVWVDVVTTDTRALDQYPVEGCLAFHGDQVQWLQKVALDGAMAGTALVYRQVDSANRWNVVYWLWPVRLDGRQLTERIWLTMADQPGDAAPDVAAHPLPATAFERARYALVNDVFAWSYRRRTASAGADPALIAFAQGVTRQLAGS